jgi:hypothetical protein
MKRVEIYVQAVWLGFHVWDSYRSGHLLGPAKPLSQIARLQYLAAVVVIAAIVMAILLASNGAFV